MIKNVWIDADSCPPQVRKHVTDYAAKKAITVYFVANKQIDCQSKNPFNMIITDSTKDSADNYIFDHTAADTDLVITRDIVFADRLVAKGVHVINDRGTEFTKEIIKERLSERDFNLQLVQLGLSKPYHEGYDQKKFEKFANCLDRVIVRNL
ncbi:MAG: DUF188 domain-containing protein [Treponema sp.]|nr:DUF188 domain-containing protein [Treponema sp.]